MTLILLLVHQLPQKESSFGIESKIASYEVFNGSVPSLDVAIMTHIFSYIKATSTDSRRPEELENESDDTSSQCIISSPTRPLVCRK
jgi:hypothetical protein